MTPPFNKPGLRQRAKPRSAALGLPLGQSAEPRPNRSAWDAARRKLAGWSDLEVSDRILTTGGEGGILCQGPKGLENCSKISVSEQPRWVVCASSMYRTGGAGSRGFERMVNAFHHHRTSIIKKRLTSGLTKTIGDELGSACLCGNRHPN